MSDEQRFLAIVTADPTYAELFSLVVRPNPRLAPRHVYAAKTARWAQQWPELTVLPWNDDAGLPSGSLRRAAGG